MLINASFQLMSLVDLPKVVMRYFQMFASYAVKEPYPSIASLGLSHSTVFLTALYNPALTVGSLHISSIAHCLGNQFTEFFIQQRQCCCACNPWHSLDNWLTHSRVGAGMDCADKPDRGPTGCHHLACDVSTITPRKQQLKGSVA